MMGRPRLRPEQLERTYAERPLIENYPDLERLGVESYRHEQGVLEDAKIRDIRRLISQIARIIHLPEAADILVVGTGPNPVASRELLGLGHKVAGVEPIAPYVAAANAFLGGGERVRIGTAEDSGFAPSSFDVVLMESVFEHVDSPSRALAECHRVLRPGGLLYIVTTNAPRFSLRGDNGEYRVPFFNYLPRLVQEMYVNQHLLYEPYLANHTPRPAVHWHSYARMCAAGREAGFAQFFSKIDVVRADEQPAGWRRRLLLAVKYNPWLRALVLLQFGGTIFMVKRRAAAAAPPAALAHAA